MKRVRWKLIEKFFPRGGDVEWAYARRRGGSCRSCGKCCILLRLPVSLEYLRDVAKAWRSWARRKKKPLPGSWAKWIRDTSFLIDNFVPVSRLEAFRRGFRKSIEADDFFYQCRRVTDEGKCSVYDNGRPLICTGYPFYADATYPKGTKKVLSRVLKSCGFAGPRKASGR